MRITLLESYYGGSHKTWADGYQRASKHEVELITMPAQFWKWRMQGGAITFARLLESKPDLIIASSMIDLSIFRALTFRRLGNVPIALYLHENQLSYPQNKRQGHGWRYGFINYVSALCADAVYFNSDFHMSDFMTQLPRMLKNFRDYYELQTIAEIRAKARVLPVGIDLRRYDRYSTDKDDAQPPTILWNHRWEEDKDPAAFVNSMIKLAAEGYEFRLAITGENFGKMPQVFHAAQSLLSDKLIQLGYVDEFADYARLLWQSDYVVSSAWQEFFGISICEAIYCGCLPILPDRLNYPHLLTEALKSACLYQRGRLTEQLRYHLDGKAKPDTTSLRAKIAAFDWTVVGPRYDAELEDLVTRLRRDRDRRHLTRR